MSFGTIQNSFSAGEISPSLYGRTDLAKWRNGASTMRNFFANYRGGASSRAGTAYVGMCKQGAPNSGGTATDNPPKDIQFQFNIDQGYVLEFGDQYMRIKSDGAYVVEAGKTISAATSANPLVITSNAHGFSDDDWVFISGMGGMTNLNGLTWIVTNSATNTFELTDLFGVAVNSLNFDTYTSGGEAQRIYTVEAPYAAIDLPYLKFTQSADTMTLCCVNQPTQTEYPSYELVRHAATNWTFTQDSFDASIAAPALSSVTAHNSTTPDTWYSYVVTAVAASTGEESVASNVGSAENNDISVNAGSNTITWDSVSGAGSYNVYKATPSYGVEVPIGSSFGFAGSAFGTQFTDTNITADFTQVPPLHKDPFARGSIADVPITANGTGYTQATVGYTITTSTGSGFAGAPIVVGDGVVAFYVESGGKDYDPADTIDITDGGGGTGATATLTIGPRSGTYPSDPAYYQQRRFYANTLNNPDTYYGSQPGAYNNMDSSVPLTDSDAIIGTPWAQQINGIQFMVPMTGGLVILTGNGAWQLTGGNSSEITPSDQNASAQAYNGCSSIVPPLVVNYDILYVQSKGSIVRDLSYNFFVNIYTGTDQTVLSSHLFLDHQILQWTYAEEPYKLIWCVRDDGILLSFTYLKEQDVYAWARHDTNGQYVSVCSVTELPVNAVYIIVKRYVNGHWVYYSERMNNRLWTDVEECFCVDAGLSWPMNSPVATLTPAAAAGTSNITDAKIIAGGSNYTNPTIRAVDPTGLGTGATFAALLSGGAIVGITPITTGHDYGGGTTFDISDPAGSGAIAQPIITNIVTFTASASVFSPGDVGNVIRVGGGKATITSYVSGTEVNANISIPITQVIPNNPQNMPAPAVSGTWTLTPTTDVVTGLNHLEGLEVAILADGSVVPNQVVTDGQITLPAEYSAITIGLPYVCQLQTLYLDPPNQPTTPQGRRKDIYNACIRVENSRGIQVGTNQPDAATEPNGATLPWANMTEVKERNSLEPPGTAIPLYTGDYYLNLISNWSEYGQTAIQQTYPLPANLLACVSFYQMGDTPG